MANKYYFRPEHQQAVLDYVSCNDRSKREEIYINILEPAFNEMVEKIVYTYKFASLPNIESAKDECKTNLITILQKFDINHGSTAFAYFSVITKNFFIQYAKKSAQKMKREIFYEEITDTNEHDTMICHNNYLEDRERAEFWSCLLDEVNRWEGLEMKENDERVFKAVKVLLNHNDAIDVTSKKAYYLYLRELTGLSTKQIVQSLNKFRKHYKVFKKNWEDPNKFQ